MIPPEVLGPLCDRWQAAPQPLPECHWQFPEPAEWPDHDLIAKGADLEPPTLIEAYRRGLFPMRVRARDRAPGWWSPDPRGILPLDGMRVTRSLSQSARKYSVRVDTSFTAVIQGCANPERQHGWIDQAFIGAYVALHELGWAHSVEVFDRDGRLSGGLYGVRINGLFAGESMFHVGRDASKVALLALVELMTATGMTLLDVQWRTDFLASLGAIDIAREHYLSLLRAALAVPHRARLPRG